MYICIHTHPPLSKLYDSGDHICIFVSFIVAYVIFFMKDSPYSKGGHMTNKRHGQGLYLCCCPFAWTVNSSRKGVCLPISFSLWCQLKVGLKSVPHESTWLNSSSSPSPWTPSPDLPALKTDNLICSRHVVFFSVSLFDRKILQALRCHSSYDNSLAVSYLSVTSHSQWHLSDWIPKRLQRQVIGNVCLLPP